MDMRIKTMVLGHVQTNCYLVYEEGSGRGVIIDPADNGPAISAACREAKVTPEAILLTHGHGDHILAADGLRQEWKIPVIASETERELLADPSLNLSLALGMPRTSLKADREVRDGEVVEAAGFHFQVIATPGHTKGSVCYLEKEEKVLFSGDTLFEQSLGRTDFPTGSAKEIVESITGKLFALLDDTMVYPGHGDPTVIGREKQYNPVARYRR